MANKSEKELEREELLEAQKELSNMYKYYGYHYMIYGIRTTEKSDMICVDITGTSHFSLREMALLVYKACKKDTGLFLKHLLDVVQEYDERDLRGEGTETYKVEDI